MKHIKEFERFASTYQNYKIIQTRVARHLVEKSAYRGKYILDLGAGSGEVYRAIEWDFKKFYALDLSINMLRYHPKKRVEKILCNFDEENCWEMLKTKRIDQIFASSSLQWSKDLEKTFFYMKKIASSVSCALFTSKTFHTIHQILEIDSPIRSEEEILLAAKKNFMVNYEKRAYRLFFPKRELLFAYIKKSGVSAGEKRADIAKLRKLIKSYPKNYLEFEVIFLWCDG